MDNIEVTEKSIVELYEILNEKIINELSLKYNDEPKLIRIMIEISRERGYNLLEAKELITEFENIYQKRIQRSKKK